MAGYLLMAGINPDISSITLEIEIMALFDAIPDGCKTQRFWEQFKHLS